MNNRNSKDNVVLTYRTIYFDIYDNRGLEESELFLTRAFKLMPLEWFNELQQVIDEEHIVREDY